MFMPRFISASVERFVIIDGLSYSIEIASFFCVLMSFGMHVKGENPKEKNGWKTHCRREDNIKMNIKYLCSELQHVDEDMHGALVE
jgi:hypothetical protein